MIENIEWRRNNVIPLMRLASCLIVLDGTVYAAVWSGNKQAFLMYPEDFGTEKLSQIDFWTYYPKGPVTHD